MGLLEDERGKYVEGVQEMSAEGNGGAELKERTCRRGALKTEAEAEFVSCFKNIVLRFSKVTS